MLIRNIALPLAPVSYRPNLIVFLRVQNAAGGGYFREHFLANYFAKQILKYFTFRFNFVNWKACECVESVKLKTPQQESCKQKHKV